MPPSLRFKSGGPERPSSLPHSAAALNKPRVPAATLNASANPNGGNTSVYFQYGLTTSYGSTTSATGIGSGASSQNVAITINGLAVLQVVVAEPGTPTRCL